jgi:hypothetical protein
MSQQPEPPGHQPREAHAAEVRDRYSASDDDLLIENGDEAVGQETDDESSSETGP